MNALNKGICLLQRVICAQRGCCTVSRAPTPLRRVRKSGGIAQDSSACRIHPIQSKPSERNQGNQRTRSTKCAYWFQDERVQCVHRFSWLRAWLKRSQTHWLRPLVLDQENQQTHSCTLLLSLLYCARAQYNNSARLGPRSKTRSLLVPAENLAGSLVLDQENRRTHSCTVLLLLLLHCARAQYYYYYGPREPADALGTAANQATVHGKARRRSKAPPIKSAKAPPSAAGPTAECVWQGQGEAPSPHRSRPRPAKR